VVLCKKSKRYEIRSGSEIINLFVTVVMEMFYFSLYDNLSRHFNNAVLFHRPILKLDFQQFPWLYFFSLEETNIAFSC